VYLLPCNIVFVFINQGIERLKCGTGGKEAIAAVFTLLETQRRTVTVEVLKPSYFYVSL
jgi:hypothetical protein